MDKAHWPALAAKPDLSPGAIDFLADTDDVPTAIALSRNKHVRLTAHAVEALAELSKRDDTIARPLLSRPEVTESVARSLYPHVGEDLKAYLRTYFAVEDAGKSAMVVDFSDAASAYMPSAKMLDAAGIFARAGMLSMPIMLEALQRGKIAVFVAFLARFIGMEAKQVHDYLSQPCPKALIIACRALGVQKSDFARVYLLTNRMRAQGRMVDQDDMRRTLAYFDKVTPAVAGRIWARTGR